MSRATPLRAHLATPALRIEGRRAARRALRLETSGATVGGEADGEPANVTVHNISPAGLLLETDLALEVGEVLAVDLPETGPVGAEIVWASDHIYGCAFQQALGEAALAAAERRGEIGGLGEAAPARPQVVPFGDGALETFGHRLNTLRRERSLTLAQVAEALGVSKPTVWAWEKGKARPLPERLSAIAEVLGVSESELSRSGSGGEGAQLVQDCRMRIAAAYGTEPHSVKIMIEV